MKKHGSDLVKEMGFNYFQSQKMAVSTGRKVVLSIT